MNSKKKKSMSKHTINSIQTEIADTERYFWHGHSRLSHSTGIIKFKIMQMKFNYDSQIVEINKFGKLSDFHVSIGVSGLLDDMYH